MTVQEFIRLGIERLDGVVDSPLLECQVLAAHVLMTDRSWIIAHPEAELPDLAMEVLLQRREVGEPLAYILGWREFYGRRFAVRPGVLIPRQDTETLIETCLGLSHSPHSVLDIGTGSGIIGITLKLERPTWSVTVSDISPQALAIALENAESLQAEIEGVESDLFAAFEGRKFDLFVSNPPYIGSGEKLAKEVKSFEPHLALYSGKTGFEIYEQIVKHAPSYLNQGGHLVLELGYQSLSGVTDLLNQAGWRINKVVKDLSAIDRCIVASMAD